MVPVGRINDGGSKWVIIIDLFSICMAAGLILVIFDHLILGWSESMRLGDSLILNGVFLDK